MSKELENAYKRLNVEEYVGIIKDTMIPYFDDYDGEFVTLITPETKLTIKPQYYHKKLMGYNIYADNVLLETKSTVKKAKKFIENLVNYKGELL